MAVLTLEPALPRERQSGPRGPLGIVLCLLLVVMISSSSLLAYRNRVTAIPLDAAAVAVGPGGALVEVSAADDLVPGSRVLAGMPDSADLARKQAAWLAAGTVPSISGLDSDMVAMALLDLHVLSGAVRRPGRRLGPTLALRVAARLGAGRVGAGTYRDTCRRRTHRGLPAASAAGVWIVPGPLPARWQWSTGCSRRRARRRRLGVVGDWTGGGRAERGATVRHSCSGIGCFLTAAPKRHCDRSRTDPRLPPASTDYWEVKEERLTLATAAMTLRWSRGRRGAVPNSRRRSRGPCCDRWRDTTESCDQDKLWKERLSAASRRAQRQHRSWSRFSAAAARRQVLIEASSGSGNKQHR